MKYITQAEAKEIDAKLVEMGFKIDSLIEIAGVVAFEVILEIFKREENFSKETAQVLIIVGPGNNGADSLVVGRYLHMYGVNVTIHYIETKHSILLNICDKIGIKIITTLPDDIIKYDFIIDAIFGFSYRPPLQKPYAEIVDSIKNHKKIISIDVPTSYEIDKINESPIFVPFCVVSLVAPKICCKNLKTFVARNFAPIQVYKDGSSYSSFTEL